MKNWKILMIWLIILSGERTLGQELFTFQSSDGIKITADWYAAQSSKAPVILLFHQAGWSRGEYSEIAPKLNKMGFNCLAVDLRSGNTVNGIINETAKRARDSMKPTEYLDALPDIIASIEYARANLESDQILIWGSSYSSSLVLKVSGDRPDLVDGVLAFSPGEYFSRFGKPGDFISTSASNIVAPVFITSARNEKNRWWSIYENIPSERKSYLVPETSGNHGSRALWEKFPDHQVYWEAVTKFLRLFL